MGDNLYLSILIMIVILISTHYSVKLAKHTRIARRRGFLVLVCVNIAKHAQHFLAQPDVCQCVYIYGRV